MIIKVLVPSHEHVHALFSFDLANMMALTAAMMPPDEGHQLGLALNIGTYLHKSRTELLASAVQEGVDMVLWLDSDMRFPRDLLIRLLQHQKPVVGINYALRHVPTDYVAIKRIPEGPDDAGDRLRTTAESTGLEEVDALGFGAVLMDLKYIRRFLPNPNETPWFALEQPAPNGGTYGEDVYFCKFMLRDNGVPIYVDHDLSWQCAHIGTFEYRCAHAEIEWDEVEADRAALHAAAEAEGD